MTRTGSPDIVAWSPGRRYRMEARSPDNATDPPRGAYLGNFVYTLYHGESDDVVFRADEETIDPPRAVFVHDSGWAAVWFWWDDLVVFAPDGRRGRAIPLRGEGGIDERHVYESTAGLHWARFSHWYFVEIGGRLHLCVRAQWGQRLLIDLAGGVLVPLPVKGAMALRIAEREFALDTLEEAASKPIPADRDGRDWSWSDLVDEMEAVQTAVLLAGQERVLEAAEPLGRLEPHPYSALSAGRYGALEATETEIVPFCYKAYSLRQLVQLSLRRLGVKPAGWPATAVGNHVLSPSARFPWRMVALAAPGMTAGALLAALGPPDRISVPVWQYDIDDPGAAFTLNIIWSERWHDHRDTVAKVERIVPAYFQDPEFCNWTK
jgi:hypothetical protein